MVISPLAKTLTKKRLFGIAGKDVIAGALITQGINMWNSGDQMIGAILLATGSVMFLVQFVLV